MKTKIATGILLIWSLFLVVNCSKENDNKIENSTGQTSIAYQTGEKVFKQRCTSCHSLKKEDALSIAPSMEEIKDAYLKTTNSEAAFVNVMTNFLERPTPTTSKMPAAVKQYGIMPNMGLAKEEYQSFATYLFQMNLSNETTVNQGDDSITEEIQLTEENALPISIVNQPS